MVEGYHGLDYFSRLNVTKGYEVNNVRNEKIASGFIGSV